MILRSNYVQGVHVYFLDTITTVIVFFAVYALISSPLEILRIAIRLQLVACITTPSHK